MASTNWTFTELDAQDRTEVDDHIKFLNKRDAILWERRQREQTH